VTAARPEDPAPAPRVARLRPGWVLGGVLAVVLATLCGLAFGPVRLPVDRVGLELLDQLPGIRLHSGLSAREAAIVTVIRLPRVVLGLLVGAMLALAGACFQGVFRNPLADPYLLGVAAGAGFGATVGIVVRHAASAESAAGAAGAVTPLTVPLAAFAGAIGAVGLTYALGAAGTRYRTPATLILAGVAVSAFLAAAQTYLQQRNVDTIRDVYAWLLGRLSTQGWHDVLILLPYAAVTGVILVAAGRRLDVLAVGDDEAASLGIHPQRTRYLLILAAALATAAAVSVSGLIGFVGIIVPHTVRLLAGVSYRVILPLSTLFGAAFLVLADLAARVILAPAETPIGVVTAFLGAPFFVLVLRTSRRAAL
jgi:iron complex transport system permease protein